MDFERDVNNATILKLAAIDWHGPGATAGLGGLAGAGMGALMQYMFNKPNERNYLGGIVNGALGGAVGSLAGRGLGLSGNPSDPAFTNAALASMQGALGGTFQSMFTPDNTDMRFQTQREIDEMQQMLNDPSIDQETKGYIRQYIAAQKQQYGL